MSKILPHFLQCPLYFLHGEAGSSVALFLLSAMLYAVICGHEINISSCFGYFTRFKNKTCLHTVTLKINLWSQPFKVIEESLNSSFSSVGHIEAVCIELIEQTAGNSFP